MHTAYLVTREDLNESYREGLGEYKTLLSLDGGGLRGVITAQVLIKLEGAIKTVICKHKDILLKDSSKHKVEGGMDSFEINLGDWFDQLAGTSTGGLLALYFAARGGQRQKSYDNARPGSAQNASNLYLKNGERIFGTDLFAKFENLINSGGKNCHTADGLEAVLQEVFGDATPSALELVTGRHLEVHIGPPHNLAKPLSSLESSVVVPTVDVDNARTGIFFLKNSKADWNQTPEDANSKGKDQSTPVAQLGRKVPGFACPLRRSSGTQVLVQETPRRTKEQVLDGKVEDMHLKNMKLMRPELAVPKCNTHGWWLAPMEMKANLDFKIREVARTTSAAPCFLPPVTVAPLNKKAASRAKWPEEGFRFIDGGLANNDPTWMGLSMMLMGDDRSGDSASIANTAILSIGTGISTSCGAYNEGMLDLVRGFIMRRMGLMGLAIQGLGLLQGLIGLTMNMNGEDKENILNMIYYGLLRVPRGQYLRIQLKQVACSGDSSAAAPGPGSNSNTKGDGGAGPISLTPQEIAALDQMDEPKMMEHYVSIGKKLANRYEEHLECFVRFYVFNLSDPYTERMPDAELY